MGFFAYVHIIQDSSCAETQGFCLHTRMVISVEFDDGARLGRADLQRGASDCWFAPDVMVAMLVVKNNLKHFHVNSSGKKNDILY